MGYSGGQVVGFDKLSPDVGFNYNPLNDPISPTLAPIQRPLGIDGDIIVGTSANNTESYYYNVNDGKKNDMNHGGNLNNAQPRDISGNLIVGSVSSSSFIFDTSTNQIVDGLFKHTSGSPTRAWGIDGNVMVGEVGSSGFIYTFDILGGTISGSWRTFDGSDFGLTDVTRVNIQGISGNYISGFYDDTNGSTYGFYYDYANETDFNTIVAPEPSTFMQARAIEGNIIAGSYRTGSGDVGFLYQIPEPSMFMLAASPILLLFLRRRRS